MPLVYQHPLGDLEKLVRLFIAYSLVIPVFRVNVIFDIFLNLLLEVEKPLQHGALVLHVDEAYKKGCLEDQTEIILAHNFLCLAIPHFHCLVWIILFEKV